MKKGTVITVGVDAVDLEDAVGQAQSIYEFHNFTCSVFCTVHGTEDLKNPVYELQVTGVESVPDNLIGKVVYAMVGPSPTPVKCRVIDNRTIHSVHPWPVDLSGGYVYLYDPLSITIKLPAGSHHTLQRTLNIPPFTSIVGEPGAKATIYGGSEGHYLRYDSVNECSLENLSIVQHAEYPAQLFMIALSSRDAYGFMCDTMRIHNCSISGGPVDTIFAGNRVGQLSITQCDLEGNWDILKLGQLRHIYLSLNTFRSVALGGNVIGAVGMSIGAEQKYALNPYPIEVVSITGNLIESVNKHPTPAESCGIDLFEFQNHAQISILGNTINVFTEHAGHYTAGILIEGENAFSVISASNVMDLKARLTDAYTVAVLSSSAQCRLTSQNYHADGSEQHFSSMTPGFF